MPPLQLLIEDRSKPALTTCNIFINADDTMIMLMITMIMLVIAMIMMIITMIMLMITINRMLNR